MCGGTPVEGGYTTPPEVVLADAIKTHLKVEVDPAALRAFVRDRWNMLSVTAHRIHEGADVPAVI